MAAWIVFGGFAVISTILNVAWSFRRREAKWFRYAGLAFAALTLCSFYQVNAVWVIKEDWSALIDVVPNMSKVLWIFTIVSILINGISLHSRFKR